MRSPLHSEYVGALHGALRYAMRRGASAEEAMQALEDVAAQVYSTCLSGAVSAREVAAAYRVYIAQVQGVRARLPCAEADDEIEAELGQGRPKWTLRK